MEVRGTVHSPPFWASTSNAANSSPLSPYSNSSTNQSGIKPWIFVLLFSVVVLLFLPSILSSPFRNTRLSLSIKSGWDMLNLCLVVFAILCGVLSRTGDGSDSGSGSDKQLRGEWMGFSNRMGEENRTAGIRRMRSSSSYPDLRVETEMWGQSRVPDSLRFFDDAELYRTQRPAQPYRVTGFGEEERELKTIHVDTERLPQMEEAEKETNFEEGKLEKETIYEEKRKGGEAMAVRRRRRSLEALPKMKEVEKEPVVVVGRRRRRSLERFPLIEEVERETNLGAEVEEDKVEKRRMAVRRRRKSLENFPKMEEVKKETNFEEETAEKPPMVVVSRRKRSSEKLPEIDEVEKHLNCEETMVEKPPMVVEVAPPPPRPPPPPPPPETKMAEECRMHKRSVSGGGAKDLASAIALFYQKKRKGNKSKRKEKQEETSIDANPNLNSTPPENNTSSSTAPPPPPPPPPASIFSQLFSNKKGGSKSRRIHSLSVSTHSSSSPAINIITTPPPPPLPPHVGSHQHKKHQISSSGYKRIEESELYEYRRKGRSNLSPYANYPLPPRSPLPPPPPPLPPVCENATESREEEESGGGGSVAVFCASPDVNDKADLFIERFRAGLKLEKINSIKEKEKRKGRQERGEKFGGEHV